MKSRFPAVAGNCVGIRNVVWALAGRAEFEVLKAPSDGLMLTETVSDAPVGFTRATAVIKCEVLSKGTRMRLAAAAAGAVAS